MCRSQNIWLMEPLFWWLNFDTDGGWMLPTGGVRYSASRLPPPMSSLENSFVTESVLWISGEEIVANSEQMNVDIESFEESQPYAQEMNRTFLNIGLSCSLDHPYAMRPKPTQVPPGWFLLLITRWQMTLQTYELSFKYKFWLTFCFLTC